MQGFQVFFEIPDKPPVELHEGESIIGRSRQATVHIPETTVSRQHARVVVAAGGRVAIADLGSSNGTFVNGDRIAGERKLADGDRVLIGEAEMTIRILAPIEASDATVRVSIPPLTAPPGVAPAPPAPAPPPAPVAPAAPPPALSPPPPPRPAPALDFDRPFDPPLRPEPPAAAPRTPPPPPLRPAATAPAGVPAAALAAPRGEVLGSIADIEKLPVPAPKHPSSATGPLAAPVAAAGALQPAGFWIRVLATLIDSVIGGVVIGVLVALGIAAAFVLPPEVGMLVSTALSALAGLGYMFLFMLYLPATRGATPGKKLLGLAIVTEQTRPGQGLGWAKAFLRLVGHFASSLVFSIGYLLVAFTSRKQGLHDMIAGTYVVRTR